MSVLLPQAAKPFVACTDLSHRRLRVEQEVAERSLENPSELGQEARVVGDGPGGGGGGPLPPLDDPLWDRQEQDERSVGVHAVSRDWNVLQILTQLGSALLVVAAGSIFLHQPVLNASSGYRHRVRIWI